MQRIIVLAATTAAAICVWLGLSHFDTNGTGALAFAQTVEQIQKAKNITWTDNHLRAYHEQGRSRGIGTGPTCEIRVQSAGLVSGNRVR